MVQGMLMSGGSAAVTAVVVIALREWARAQLVRERRREREWELWSVMVAEVVRGRHARPPRPPADAGAPVPAASRRPPASARRGGRQGRCGCEHPRGVPGGRPATRHAVPAGGRKTGARRGR
jgi:hypothetical protein